MFNLEGHRQKDQAKCSRKVTAVRYFEIYGAFNGSTRTAAHQSQDLHHLQTKDQKHSDLEGGSVIVDSAAIESLERLMLSEPTQKMENCLNTNWQQLEMLVAILQQHSHEQAEEIFTIFCDQK